MNSTASVYNSSTADSITFTYSADGLRKKKTVNGTATEYTYGAMVTEWEWHNKWFDYEEKRGYDMFKSNCEHVDLDMYPLANSECPFWQFVGTGIARIGERIC